jgi:hypothetical protein
MSTRCYYCNQAANSQCPKCGRFHCALHSISILCTECATLVATADTTQQTYDDYLRAAKQVVSPGTTAFVIIIVVVGIIALNSSSSSWWIATALCLLLAAWVAFRTYRKISEIDRVKPGFKSFYWAWRRRKDKESLMLMIGIATLFAKAVIKDQNN